MKLLALLEIILRHKCSVCSVFFYDYIFKRTLPSLSYSSPVKGVSNQKAWVSSRCLPQPQFLGGLQNVSRWTRKYTACAGLHGNGLLRSRAGKKEFTFSSASVLHKGIAMAVLQANTSANLLLMSSPLKLVLLLWLEKTSSNLNYFVILMIYLLSSGAEKPSLRLNPLAVHFLKGVSSQIQQYLASPSGLQA